MPFVDSHCHINFPELATNIGEVLAHMRDSEVISALCVSVNLADFPQVLALAEQHPHIYASVGVHPDYEGVPDNENGEPDVTRLVTLARHPRIIAIGETGLDYFRLKGDLEWQRDAVSHPYPCRTQIDKPLIIHTRAAADDTLRIMKEENAAEAGGVMHCFTETWEVAEAAMAMGFYISFSGIVTFKNAAQLKDSRPAYTAGANADRDRLAVSCARSASRQAQRTRLCQACRRRDRDAARHQH